jgi:hypothetical protein
MKKSLQVNILLILTHQILPVVYTFIQSGLEILIRQGKWLLQSKLKD